MNEATTKTSIAFLNEIIGTADSMEEQIEKTKSVLKDMMKELFERDERFKKLVALYMALDLNYTPILHANPKQLSGKSRRSLQRCCEADVGVLK